MVTSSDVFPDFLRAEITVTTNVGADIPLYEVGVIVSKDSNPTLENGTIFNRSVNTSSITYKTFYFKTEKKLQLTINTKYYYRSYVYTYTDGQYYYDEVKSFKTLDVSPESVADMGTGVKWARCNIGASSPEEFGDYYAWGETKTKDVYSKETYTYYNNGKYVDLGKDISGTAFDVAHVKLGGTWRMPTKEEWEKLSKDCQWWETKYNGIYGYLVISRSNNNSIFLPYAGYRENSSCNDYDGYYYWSSSLDENDYSCGMYFGNGVDCNNSKYRYYGMPIRAVCE